eukprot:CAMPEP_0179903360 /NCGR_PEP_ID=MMETSP0982-20121206/41217_1 /TAXON_ID=483367 /ORGANISM="non described non described, Strain CCMP 2436" /LENGTH=50 /DNA_ID=CAMNT_0021802891 /DNA_START=98 /DNA_END=247 /DNA_ORIENTATION=-
MRANGVTSDMMMLSVKSDVFGPMSGLDVVVDHTVPSLFVYCTLHVASTPF